jgi:hypothetical protein
MAPRTLIGLDSGYSRRGLARLALSAAAAELSDRARLAVHGNADRHVAAGELVENALALVAQADEVLNRAIVLERERGTSWSVLGDALRVSKQAAQQKHGPSFEQWRDALDEPLRRGRGNIFDCQLPDGPDDPDAHVARLDTWIARHCEPEVPPRSVSAGLERASLVDRVADLARQARRMVHEDDPAKRQAYYARKATLLSRIAEADPSNNEAADAADAARRTLAQLDAEENAP